MNILNNPNIEFFRYKIFESLNYNLSEKNCSTLANILAIDYVTRVNSTKDVLSYLYTSISRIEKYLGKKTIVSEDFGIILELFAVAITNTSSSNNDTIIIDKEESQELISNIIIETYFKDLSKEDKKNIKLVLKTLSLTGDIFTYIKANTELFKQTILSHANNYKHIGAIDDNIKLIKTAINNQKMLNKETNYIEQISSKIITSICVIAIGAIGFATAGLAFSAILIPYAVMTLRYAPTIGKKLGKLLNNFDFKNIKIKKEINYLNNIIQDNNHFLDKKLKIESIINNKLNIASDVDVSKHMTTNKMILSKQTKNTQITRDGF